MFSIHIFLRFSAIRDCIILLMNSDLFFDNKKYIPAKNASSLTGYSKDYIGQLCRHDKVLSKKIGKAWYVEEESLLAYNTSFLKESPYISQKPKLSETFVSNDTSPLKATTPNSWQKARQLTQELLFTVDFSLSKKVLPFALGLIFIIGAVSLGQSMFNFEVNYQGLSNSLNEIKSDMTSRGLTMSLISRKISNSPFKTYETLDFLTDFYSSQLSIFYTDLGFSLVNKSQSFFNQFSLIAKNPPAEIFKIFQSVSILEKNLVDNEAEDIANSISQSQVKLFALISNSFDEILSLNNHLKNGVQTLGANLFFAVTQDLNPIDHSGVVVYDTVNSWFERLIYSPITNFFNKKPTIVNTTFIATKEKEANKISSASLGGTQTITKIVNNTNVVERIIERSVSSDLTKADLELRLQELNNKIQSQLSQLSWGTGGSVTNIYQQIAQSQRIDQLTGTAITNPTITGGSITNTTINTSSITTGTLAAGTADLGTTTITNLTVTNTSTSTFAGGVAVTGGCVSVNGTCLGTGSGSGTPGGSDTQVQFNSSGSFAGSANFVWDNTNKRLGIGTSSPYQTLSVSGVVVADSFISTTTATSTFVGGISTNLLSVTSTIASSTFANGINLTGGCYSLSNSCLSLSNLTGTVATTRGGTGIDSSGLTGVAVINSGIWSASSTLSVNVGGTGWSNIQANTLLLGNSTQRLATTSAGTNGQVLALVGGVPTWVATTTFGTGLTYSAGNVTVNTTLNTTATSSLAVDGTSLSSSGTLGYQLGGTDTTLSLNLANANTWTALQTFNYSSSTIYSSFVVSSSTTANIGTLNLFSGLNGPLQANAGVVSATSSVGVLYGGTGVTKFSTNSIITSSADGLSLIATTSQLTVGSLLSTTSSASTFVGAVG